MSFSKYCLHMQNEGIVITYDIKCIRNYYSKTVLYKSTCSLVTYCQAFHICSYMLLFFGKLINKSHYK